MLQILRWPSKDTFYCLASKAGREDLRGRWNLSQQRFCFSAGDVRFRALQGHRQEGIESFCPLSIKHSSAIKHFLWCSPTRTANPSSKLGDQCGPSSQFLLTGSSHEEPRSFICLPSEELCNIQRSSLGFVFFPCWCPHMAVAQAVSHPSPRLAREHRQDSFARTKHCNQEFSKNSCGLFLRKGEAGRDVAMAALFLCGYSNRESFLRCADMWTGWLTWPSLRQGWRTEHFKFSPSFHYIIFKRQVNILGLTLTLYQYNLDFTDVYFYLYWKKKKQNHFLLLAALWRWEEKGLWVL